MRWRLGWTGDLPHHQEIFLGQDMDVIYLCPIFKFCRLIPFAEMRICEVAKWWWLASVPLPGCWLIPKLKHRSTHPILLSGWCPQKLGKTTPPLYPYIRIMHSQHLVINWVVAPVHVRVYTYTDIRRSHYAWMQNNRHTPPDPPASRVENICYYHWAGEIIGNYMMWLLWPASHGAGECDYEAADDDHDSLKASHQQR